MYKKYTDIVLDFRDKKVLVEIRSEKEMYDFALLFYGEDKRALEWVSTFKKAYTNGDSDYYNRESPDGGFVVCCDSRNNFSYCYKGYFSRPEYSDRSIVKFECINMDKITLRNGMVCKIVGESIFNEKGTILANINEYTDMCHNNIRSFDIIDQGLE